MPNKFSLGSVFGAIANDADHELRPGRNFTVKDIQEIAARACESFRSSNLEILSCFELEGEFSLWSTLQHYIQSRPTSADITKAAEAGDEAALVAALKATMRSAFIALYNKGALKRLQLVSPLPPEALDDLRRMLSAAVPVVPATAPATAPVAPAETPEDACVREFKELPSATWKTKWLSNQNNRAVADRCAAEGRL